MMRSRIAAALALLLSTFFLTACDFEVGKLPLPGGVDTGSNPMQIEVQFADVLDLVPQTAVKINEISVGKVTDVSLDEDGQTAVVTVELPADTELPSNAVAEIRQTSLLGEKFVELAPPATGVSGVQLSDGDTIPLDRTSRNAEVEEVLGALSLVLNGGGVAQLQTIVRELRFALEDREDAARSVLTQIDQFSGQLAENRTDVVDAIESLNRLARSARQQQGTINAALEELPGALDSIDRQREDLVRMLEALNELGAVGTEVIRASKQSTIESFRQLQPVLTELANSGDSFVDSFSVFLTYPFVDEVVGRDPQVARNIHFGDYTNLSVQLDLDLSNLQLPGLPCTTLQEIPDDLPLDAILDLENLCTGVSDAITRCVNNPTAANCAALPEGVLGAVCDALPVNLPGLCGARGNGNGGGRGNLPNLPNVPDLGGTLGGLLGGLGGSRNADSGSSGGGVLGGLLNRPAFDATGGASSTSASTPTRPGTGPTMEQLMQAYDPGLVSLLVPPMVVQP